MHYFKIQYMKYGFFQLVMIFILALFNGCATFYTGSNDTIHIASLPQRAKVEINGKYVGETPITLDLKRSISKRQVALIKEGYKKKTFNLGKRFNPIFLLDVLSIVGGLIDVWSGAVTPYSNKYYEMELKPIDNPLEKTVKKNFYNAEDNFYIVKWNGDTTYCNPNITADSFGRIHFTPIDGKRQSLPNDDVASYKEMSYTKSALAGLSKQKHYHNIYEAHAYWPEKRPNKFRYMTLCIKDSTYRLLALYLIHGVNDDGEFRKIFHSEGTAYYIFKDDLFIAHLRKVGYNEDLKKYFPNCSDFLKLIEEEKTSYKDLYKLIAKYKKTNGDAFYIKPK